MTRSLAKRSQLESWGCPALLCQQSRHRCLPAACCLQLLRASTDTEQEKHNKSVHAPLHRNSNDKQLWSEFTPAPLEGNVGLH